MAIITISKDSGSGTAPLDFAVGDVVKASVPSGDSYAWTFLDMPDGSAAAFDDATAQEPLFTVDVEGTYFLQVIVGGVDVGRAIAAAPYALSVTPPSIRPPAVGEMLEASALTGWGRALQVLYAAVAAIDAALVALTAIVDAHTTALLSAGKFSTDNKKMDAETAASVGDLACDVALVAAPGNAGYIAVFVDGALVVLGDGVKTDDVYFSDNAGTDAKAINAIEAGDKLYLGSSGFTLAGSEIIDYLYTL